MPQTTLESSKIARTIATNHGFIDNRHKALMGLILLNNQLEDKRQDTLKPYKITTQQYNVLRILRGQHPKAIPMQDIRRRMLDKQSDVTRLIVRLIKMELVTRDVYEHDRRIVNIAITPKGFNLLNILDKKVPSAWEFEGVSDAEIEQFIAIVEKMLN